MVEKDDSHYGMYIVYVPKFEKILIIIINFGSAVRLYNTCIYLSSIVFVFLIGLYIVIARVIQSE